MFKYLLWLTFIDNVYSSAACAAVFNLSRKCAIRAVNLLLSDPNKVCIPSETAEGMQSTGLLSEIMHQCSLQVKSTESVTLKLNSPASWQVFCHGTILHMMCPKFCLIYQETLRDTAERNQFSEPQTSPAILPFSSPWLFPPLHMGNGFKWAAVVFRRNPRNVKPRRGNVSLSQS